MRKIRRFLMTALGIYLVADLLTLLWVANPRGFPPLPQDLLIAVANRLGAKNAEEIANLEGMSGLVILVPLVTVAFWVCRRIYRARRRDALQASDRA
jgi:hypothetical protein